MVRVQLVTLMQAIVTKCINKLFLRAEPIRCTQENASYMHVFSLVYKFLFIIYIFNLLSTHLVTLNSIPATEILKEKTKAITRLPNAYDI